METWTVLGWKTAVIEENPGFKSRKVCYVFKCSEYLLGYTCASPRVPGSEGSGLHVPRARRRLGKPQ